MNVLGRIIKFILVFLAGVWLVRKLFGWVAGGANRRQASQTPANSIAAKTLHRDPWCGTFISEEISVTAEEGGQQLHFCSGSCREKYLQLHGEAALEIRA
ncbi:MAG: hypothetical protein ACRD50_04075 [Candidatus Acidiferrales bacterium]